MTEDKEAKMVFDSMVKISVGNGVSMLFWKDRWVHGFTVCEIAPLVFALVSTRAKNSRTVEQALIDNAWTQDVLGDLSFTANIQVANLCHAIATVQRNEDAQDVFHWPADPSGTYTAKSVYKRLYVGLERSPTDAGIWRSWAPLKCKFFAWLIVKYRL